MSNGYSPKAILKASKVLGASLTDEVIAESGLSASGSRNLRLDIKAESVTVGAGITLQLQQLVVDEWKDLTSANSSVSITADSTVTIKLLELIAADQADLPLAKQIRVVATTGAGSAVTLSSVLLLQAS